MLRVGLTSQSTPKSLNSNNLSRRFILKHRPHSKLDPAPVLSGELLIHPLKLQLIKIRHFNNMNKLTWSQLPLTRDCPHSCILSTNWANTLLKSSWWLLHRHKVPALLTLLKNNLAPWIFMRVNNLRKKNNLKSVMKFPGNFPSPYRINNALVVSKKARTIWPRTARNLTCFVTLVSNQCWDL